MKIYKCKAEKIKGTSFREVHKKAHQFYDLIKGKTKRKPYIRSAYFNKEKIFLDLFWSHLHEKKNIHDRIRRLEFFSCAIDLIKNSPLQPHSKESPNKNSELLHRFYGFSKEGQLFCVQIKENRNNNKKWFMSTFPFKQ